jgi:hypothetical protein
MADCGQLILCKGKLRIRGTAVQRPTEQCTLVGDPDWAEIVSEEEN